MGKYAWANRCNDTTTLGIIGSDWLLSHLFPPFTANRLKENSNWMSIIGKIENLRYSVFPISPSEVSWCLSPLERGTEREFLNIFWELDFFSSECWNFQWNRNVVRGLPLNQTNTGKYRVRWKTRATPDVTSQKPRVGNETIHGNAQGFLERLLHMVVRGFCRWQFSQLYKP